MLCLSIVLFADQINKKENERRLLHRRESTLISTVLSNYWSDSTQGSFLTKWEGLGDKVAANLRRMELANILSEWIQKTSRGACLRNRSAFILRLLQHIRPHMLEGFSSHYPSIMCIWGSCGKEVLHFVTQSNNVVLNKQGFW